MFVNHANSEQSSRVQAVMHAVSLYILDLFDLLKWHKIKSSYKNDEWNNKIKALLNIFKPTSFILMWFLVIKKLTCLFATKIFKLATNFSWLVRNFFNFEPCYSLPFRILYRHALVVSMFVLDTKKISGECDSGNFLVFTKGLLLHLANVREFIQCLIHPYMMLTLTKKS